MGLRSRLSSLNEPIEEVAEQPLTPMNARFIQALESIQELNPTFGVFARKFATMAKRKPIPDEVLAESLTWARDMIAGILTGEIPAEALEVVRLSAVPDYIGSQDEQDAIAALVADMEPVVFEDTDSALPIASRVVPDD